MAIVSGETTGEEDVRCESITDDQQAWMCKWFSIRRRRVYGRLRCARWCRRYNFPSRTSSKQRLLSIPLLHDSAFIDPHTLHDLPPFCNFSNAWRTANGVDRGPAGKVGGDVGDATGFGLGVEEHGNAEGA